MQKKNLKKGVVKKIERQTFSIVILGPVNKDSGLYREKQVVLHCIEPLEEFTAEAFEFMRKTLVGNEVEFNDYDLGEKTGADIFIDGKNVAFLLASEGLVKYFKAGQKTSVYYDDIVEGDAQAEKNKKGQYSEQEADPKKKKKKPKKLTLEEFIGKEITGTIEEINYKLDFQVFVQELGESFTASLAGVSIPVISKEHVTHFRNYTAKHVIQRLRKFKIKPAETYQSLSLVEMNCSEDESIAKAWFTAGYARLDKEAGSKLDLVEMMVLKSLQDQGMNSGKGIWKDYKGKLPQNDKKNDVNADLYKLLQNPEFEAQAISVHSGDSVTIETEAGRQLRINLTNLKAKSIGNPVKNEEAQPWAFEAKELLRKKIIGKKLKVKVDNIRNVVTEERTFDIINATLYLDNSPVALELVEKGLLTLVPPKMSDPASGALVAYSEANKKAETLKKGIHSESKPTKKFWDLSKPENRKKAKTEFSLENYKDLNDGVVENIMSATRFKIRFDQENCYFILSLNSVKGVPNNINNKTEEKWANEALDFAKKIASQRDVKFEIEQVDKNGVAHGSIFIGKENIALTLLSRGLVFVEKSFRFSKHINDYQKVQDAAKGKSKGIWSEPDLNLTVLGEEGEEATQSETKIVTLSEFYNANDFFLQESKSENFLKIEKTLKKSGDLAQALKEPILMNTIAIGKFEGDYNRCKILTKTKSGDYNVEFIDYGNTSHLNISELRQCPNEIQKIPAQAMNARLDYIVTPPSKSGYANKTNQFFENLGVNAKLKCKITRKQQGIVYCLLWLANSDEDVKKSINYTLVKDGLAITDANLDIPNVAVWDVAGQSGAEKNPDLISYMNNIDY